MLRILCFFGYHRWIKVSRSFYYSREVTYQCSWCGKKHNVKLNNGYFK